MLHRSITSRNANDRIGSTWDLGCRMAPLCRSEYTECEQAANQDEHMSLAGKPHSRRVAKEGARGSAWHLTVAGLKGSESRISGSVQKYCMPER